MRQKEITHSDIDILNDKVEAWLIKNSGKKIIGIRLETTKVWPSSPVIKLANNYEFSIIRFNYERIIL